MARREVKVPVSNLAKFKTFIQMFSIALLLTGDTGNKIINDEIVGLMKSAGCKSIQIGVESGSNWMLKKIRKGINRQDVLDTCKIIKKHKIQLHTFL